MKEIKENESYRWMNEIRRCMKFIGVSERNFYREWEKILLKAKEEKWIAKDGKKRYEKNLV